MSRAERAELRKNRRICARKARQADSAADTAKLRAILASIGDYPIERVVAVESLVRGIPYPQKQESARRRRQMGRRSGTS